MATQGTAWQGGKCRHEAVVVLRNGRTECQKCFALVAARREG